MWAKAPVRILIITSCFTLVDFQLACALSLNSVISRLRKDYPNLFGKCITHTTRAPRGQEQHGVAYYFVTREQFEEEWKAGNLVGMYRIWSDINAFVVTNWHQSEPQFMATFMEPLSRLFKTWRKRRRFAFWILMFKDASLWRRLDWTPSVYSWCLLPLMSLRNVYRTGMCTYKRN